MDPAWSGPPRCLPAPIISRHPAVADGRDVETAGFPQSVICQAHGPAFPPPREKIVFFQGLGRCVDFGIVEGCLTPVFRSSENGDLSRESPVRPLHPEKTHILYCKDDDRRRHYPNEKFDSLGYSVLQKHANRELT